jgi:hypothetical protein
VCGTVALSPVAEPITVTIVNSTNPHRTRDRTSNTTAQRQLSSSRPHAVFAVVHQDTAQAHGPGPRGHGRVTAAGRPFDAPGRGARVPGGSESDPDRMSARSWCNARATTPRGPSRSGIPIRYELRNRTDLPNSELH